jgi:hypothetical protein
MRSPQLAGLIELGELTKLNELGELIELDMLSQCNWPTEISDLGQLDW